MEGYPIIAYVSFFSPILPVLSGIYRLRTINREMKILLILLAIDLITNVVTLLLINNYWINLAIWHIYIVFEYICIMTIILLWQELKSMSRLFKSLIILYIIFWLCAKFAFEPISGLYSITVSVSQAILVLSAGYTLFIVIGNHTQPLLNNQRFWYFFRSS